jgi:hypothetical protein
MAEEKLDLLQLASCCPTEASTCPTQVVWREPFVADPRGEFLNYVPNQLLGPSVARGPAGTAHFTEELSSSNARCYYPVVQRTVDPIWYRDGSDVSAFPTRSTIAQCSSRC